MASVIAWLDTELKIDATPDSELVNLKLMCDDADEALTLIKAITQSYMKEIVEKDDSQRAARVSEHPRVEWHERHLARNHALV